MKRRVVITSMGIISSLGSSPSDIINNLKTKKVNFDRPIFDEEVVISPIKDFNVRNYTGSFKDSRYLSRGAQFAVAAAIEAIKCSGREIPKETGLFVGTGPNLDIGGEFPEVTGGEIDRRDLQALWILKFLPNTAASVISKLTGVAGENLTVTTACSASLQAIGEAFRKIKDGYLDIALAGGGDSRLSRGGILAYKKAKALYTGNSDSKGASKPFDSARSGFVPGEGGAFFLLEEFETAKKRNALILGEICGYGCSMDAYNMTAPDMNGERGKAAVISAISDAGISLSQVQVISAHGTGTISNDEREAKLISDLYGRHQPHVTALKSWIGHASSACGALELAISLICMNEGYIPEIRNLKNPCHKEVNFVKNGMEEPFNNVIIENFGFGGQNSALVVKNCD